MDFRERFQGHNSLLERVCEALQRVVFGLEGNGGNGMDAGKKMGKKDAVDLSIDCEDPPSSSEDAKGEESDLYHIAAWKKIFHGRKSFMFISAWKGSLINKRDENGKCPLHLAAVHGNSSSPGPLAKHSAVDLLALDKDGRTDLQLAVLEGNLKAVSQLCKGLHIYPNIKDTSGKTALDYAIEGNLIEIEMELMKREDVKHYMDELHKKRQVYMNTANAILTLSTVITTTIIVSTPRALPTSATDFGAHYVLKTYPSVVSLMFISVMFGTAAIVAALLSYYPKRHTSATIVYVRRTIHVAFMMLLLLGVSALALGGHIVYLMYNSADP